MYTKTNGNCNELIFIYKNKSNHMKAQELRNLIREEIRRVISEQSLNEDFKSNILRRLLTRLSNINRLDVAKAFYNMSKVALDQIEDSDITKMTAAEAYRTLKKSNPKAIVFYISEKGARNPYAKDSYFRDINPGSLIGIASGDNKFYSVEYNRRGNKGIVTMVPGTGDNLGVAKTGSGYGSTGLYNVKRASEVADTAYVIDLAALKSAGKGTAEKIQLRTTQKSGATAFMTASDFKKDNLNRYNEILKTRISNQGSDAIVKGVQETIQAVSNALSKAVGEKTTGRYNSIILGVNSKGKEVTASDAAYFLRNLLDNFERYISASNSASQAAQQGDRSDYYTEQQKAYALELKTMISRAANMNF